MPGQLPDLSSAVAQFTAGQLIPPGTVYVALTTPLGNAYIDPFAAAQDPTTQRVLQALGIGVTFGVGPVPQEIAAAPSLVSNLGVIGLVVGGFLLLRLLRR
jgi:hypothetical protein